MFALQILGSFLEKLFHPKVQCTQVEANELFCKKVKAKHLYTNLLQSAVMTFWTQCNAESVLSINDSTCTN